MRLATISSIEWTSFSAGPLSIRTAIQFRQRMAPCEAILNELALKEEGRYKPVIYSKSVIRRISDHHTMLINRTRHGNMILPGHTLFTMECAPAAYAAFAANEAEKAADINILEIRAFGSFGRIYLGGEEKDIDVAAKAAEAAINSITGREMKGGGG